MSEAMFLDIMKDAIMTMVILAAPVLVVAMATGIFISLLQAITQLQEATITFVPKILACLVTLVLASPWMLHYYMDHTEHLFAKLQQIALSQEDK
jgi:flagellar biosynthesis protein FliQ